MFASARSVEMTSPSNRNDGIVAGLSLYAESKLSIERNLSAETGVSSKPDSINRETLRVILGSLNALIE